VTQTDQWDDLRQRIFYVIRKNAEEAGIPLDMRVAYGDPADELLNIAEQDKVDVIVIGSSGKGFIKRKVLGSISNRVVQNAKCSVYVVRG
jgi:nucleotide-binding universal stress UspA family protein